MSQENVELVRKAFDAFKRGGIEALLSFCPPDVAWYAIAGWLEEPVYRGHDGVRKLVTAFTDNFEDFGWEVHEVRDAGTRVVALVQMIGRIKDSGAPVREPFGVVLSDFQNGTFGEARYFDSWQQALEAVGLEE